MNSNKTDAADAQASLEWRQSRPVVLTAAAAVLAMIPLTRSVFWGSAISIMGDLVADAALAVVFVPALHPSGSAVGTKATRGRPPRYRSRPQPDV